MTSLHKSLNNVNKKLRFYLTYGIQHSILSKIRLNQLLKFQIIKKKTTFKTSWRIIKSISKWFKNISQNTK
jgi:hypothetical protein